jgi:uncharacterized damage-inducible protein DinB
MADVCYVSLRRFIDHWHGVRFVTLELLHSFFEDDLGYRLVPEWRSVGELFHHIGGHQYFVARGVLLGRWQPELGEADADWAKHRAGMCNSMPKLEGWLREAQEKLISWSQDVDVGRLEEVRDDNPWHEGARGWLLLHHAYQDELHHRGQLYAAARLLGRTPPVVYAEEHPEYWEPRSRRS